MSGRTILHTLLKTIAVLGMAGAAMMASVPGWAKDLVVATDTAFVPFEFKQGDRYVGFDIDLWDAIAKDMGVTYKLQPMDFNGIIPGLQTHQVDVGIAGITIKDERRRAVDFSDPYYDSGLLLIVPKGSAIKSGADLKGNVLAVKTGTASVDYAKANFPDAELRLFPNIDNAYLEVQTGRADAALHDAPNVLYFIKTNGQGKVQAVGPQLQAQQYGMAFEKGSELREKVNASLAKLKANGTYKAIYAKWFGEEPPKQ